MCEKIGHNRLLIEQASVERELAVIHSKLNDPAFASLLAEGRIMAIDKAVALALEE